MRNVPENELFSAYLDGELTTAEQAEVEQLLATSPAARQLLDELRALSSTLQNMPQYKLGEDISQQVLRLAERQILTQPRSPAQPAATPGRPIFRRMLNPRLLLWPGLAVAVALMLMLFGPQQLEPPDHGPVALGTRTKTEVAEREAAAGGLSVRAAGEADRATAKKETALHSGQVPAPHTVVMDDSRGFRGGATVGKAAGTFKKGAGRPGDPVELQGALFRTKRHVAERTSKAEAAETAREGQPAPDPLVAGKPAGGRPASGRPPGIQGKTGEGDTTHVVNGSDIGPVVAENGGRGRGKRGGGFHVQRGSGGGAGGQGQFTVDDVLLAYQAGQVAAVTHGVVFVDLSAKAIREKAFESSFIANGIAWEEGRTGQNAVAAEQALADALRPKQSEEGQRVEQKPDMAAGALVNLADGGDLQLVCVEATATQIEGTLKSLSARPDTFVSLAIQPAPGVHEQQHWTRYNRLGGQPPTTRGSGQTTDVRDQPSAEQDEANDAPPAEGTGAGRKFNAGDRYAYGAQLGRAWRSRLPNPELIARFRSRASDYQEADWDGLLRLLPSPGSQSRPPAKAPSGPGAQAADSPSRPASDSTASQGMVPEVPKPEVQAPPLSGQPVTSPAPSAEPAVAPPVAEGTERTPGPTKVPLEKPNQSAGAAGDSKEPLASPDEPEELRKPAEGEPEPPSVPTPPLPRPPAAAPAEGPPGPVIDPFGARSDREAVNTKPGQQPPEPSDEQHAAPGAKEAKSKASQARPSDEQKFHDRDRRQLERSKLQPPRHLVLFVLRIEPDVPAAAAIRAAESSAVELPAVAAPAMDVAPASKK